MSRRNHNARRQYTLVHTMCTIIFCVLIFLYLYFYQGDVMALAQHILSGGATSYDKFIGAVVITAVMLAVHMFVYSLLRLDRWFYWLTYLPSFLVLAILTDVTPDDGCGVYNYVWLWLAPLIIGAYVVMVRLFSEVDSLGKDNNISPGIFSKEMWLNVLCVSIMMLMVVGTGNTDVTFHHRIKTENYIIAGNYDAALKVGNDYSETDASLTMLRAYALAVTGKLPERLFEYPFVGGSSSLRPDGNKVKSMMIHNGDIVKFINTRRMGHDIIANDYELCGLLADCNLKQYVKDLSRYYFVDSMLPKHYKEALLLAKDNHIYVSDSVKFADKDMIAAYSEFQKIRKQYADDMELRRELKKHFSKTYWYYYVCNRK